jgi:nucleoid-associated protein YgaU
MGLFDQIKDALTTDDAEKAAKAKEMADQAQQAADEAKAKADEAKKSADEWAAKASGVDAEAEARTQAEEAQHRAEEIAAETQKQLDEAVATKTAAETVVVAAAAPAAPAAPAAHAAAPKPSAPQLRTHKVVSGDTLSAIGHTFGVDWREIAKLNGIKNPDLIYPGQVFKIPNS